jgi:hypothetical protein
MTPSHAPSLVRAAMKRWQGHTQAGHLGREILILRGADAFGSAEGKTAGSVYRELLAGPACDAYLGNLDIDLGRGRGPAFARLSLMTS